MELIRVHFWVFFIRKEGGDEMRTSKNKGLSLEELTRIYKEELINDKEAMIKLEDKIDLKHDKT